MNKAYVLIMVQFVSLLGTHMGHFALSLYLYKQSGSLFYYSLFALFIILPEVILAPIVGLYVDRYNKKILMLLGHAGAGLGSILILTFLMLGYKDNSIYFLLITFSSIFNSLIFITFNTFLGEEVQEGKMHIFASIIQLLFASVFIISPSLAALLMDNYGVMRVLYVDIVSCSIALIVIFFMKFKLSGHQTSREKQTLKSFLSNLKDGFVHLRKNSSLLLSLVLLALVNFSMALISVLLTPLVLSIGNISTLGMVLSISGIGMLVGSVLMLRIKTKHYLYWMNRLSLLLAAILFLAIFDISIILICIGAFLFMLLIAMIGILNYTYWQKEIPRELKGRLFGLRTSVMAISIVLGYLTSAPLSENLMLSLLEQFHFLYNLLGTRSSPEIRLLFITNGVVLSGLIGIIEKHRLKIKNINSNRRETPKKIDR